MSPEKYAHTIGTTTYLVSAPQFLFFLPRLIQLHYNERYILTEEWDRKHHAVFPAIYRYYHRAKTDYASHLSYLRRFAPPGHRIVISSHDSVADAVTDDLRRRTSAYPPMALHHILMRDRHDIVPYVQVDYHPRAVPQARVWLTPSAVHAGLTDVQTARVSKLTDQAEYYVVIPQGAPRWPDDQ